MCIPFSQVRALALECFAVTFVMANVPKDEYLKDVRSCAQQAPGSNKTEKALSLISARLEAGPPPKLDSNGFLELSEASHTATNLCKLFRI